METIKYIVRKINNKINLITSKMPPEIFHMYFTTLLEYIVLIIIKYQCRDCAGTIHMDKGRTFVKYIQYSIHKIGNFDKSNNKIVFIY